MRYYLIRKRSEFVIYTVRDDLIFPFLENNHAHILLEAASLMQLLILLEREWLFNIEWTN